MLRKMMKIIYVKEIRNKVVSPYQDVKMLAKMKQNAQIILLAKIYLVIVFNQVEVVKYNYTVSIMEKKEVIRIVENTKLALRLIMTKYVYLKVRVMVVNQNSNVKEYQIVNKTLVLVFQLKMRATQMQKLA